MRLRIATVLVGHERDVYLEALEKIERLLENALPNAVRTVVIVDNSLPRISFERVSSSTVIVGGDNTFREFSAWDRGLAYLDRVRENPDFIHFATSAFDALYSEYLSLWNERMLSSALANRAVVGHIDYYHRPIEIAGSTSQSWIRTSYFFVPLSAVHALRSAVSFERFEEVFSDDPTAPFLAEAPLSQQMQDYIRAWLTGEGTGQGVVWHSRFDLTEETLPLFRAKALAIMNEHLLSIRLREAGYPLVDVTWLSAQLASIPPERIEWRRRWDIQIEQRKA